MKLILFSLSFPRLWDLFRSDQIGLYSEGDACSGGVPSKDAELSLNTVVRRARLICREKQLDHRSSHEHLRQNYENTVPW